MGRFLISLALAATLSASDAIPASEFKQRREKLRAKLEGGTLVLFGATDAEHGDLRSGFFQEANFYYLTGWTEPGAILLLDAKRDSLVLPTRNAVVERYTGPKAAAADPDIRQRSGFDSVLPMPSLESTLFKMLEESQSVYSNPRHEGAVKLKSLLAMREIRDAHPLIAMLRVSKSASELAMMNRTIEATIEAHRAAWKAIKPGLYEYQIATIMTSAYSTAGCERNAYPPIVGSGGNSTILHYNSNRRRMDGGEVLLMDVAAECSYYASDITRTVPVSGKFTPRQREIYDIVLGAQNAALAAVKPGMTMAKTGEGSLNKIAFDYINTHGKDLKGEPLGKYFTHGLGHHVGLDVHDPAPPNSPLEEGMVITLEPGIYIPEEGIGVRIEDMVLVTKEGGKLLSGDLPRAADEIERSLAR